jgi:uncharacterized membrane protein
MIDQTGILVATGMMAAIVYLTRAGGYLVGLQFRHIGWLRPVLEALPGCAIMAILVPAARQGSLAEALALGCVLGIMWITDSVVLATISGLLILVFWEPLLNLTGY